MIDIDGLVDCGALRLDRVFRDAHWNKDREIGQYMVDKYNDNCDVIGEEVAAVHLETTIAYGIQGYRIATYYGEDAERDDGGEEYLDREKAIRTGRKHIERIKELRARNK